MSETDPVTAAYEEHEAADHEDRMDAYPERRSDADKVADVVTASVSVGGGFGVVAGPEAAGEKSARLDSCSVPGCNRHPTCAQTSDLVPVRFWDPNAPEEVPTLLDRFGSSALADVFTPGLTQDERRALMDRRAVLQRRSGQDRRTPNTPEPDPKPGDGRAVWEVVIADMRERDEMGARKYGQRLQAFDGRTSLVDAYQEHLDGAVYLRKAIIEHGAAQDACRNLEAILDEGLGDCPPSWSKRVDGAMADVRRALAIAPAGAVMRPTVRVPPMGEPVVSVSEVTTAPVEATAVEAHIVRSLLELMEADHISGGPAIRADLMGLVDGLRMRLGMRGRAHVPIEPEPTPMTRAAMALDCAATLLRLETKRVNTSPHGVPQSMALERAAGAAQLALTDLAAYQATDPSA